MVFVYFLCRRPVIKHNLDFYQKFGLIATTTVYGCFYSIGNIHTENNLSTLKKHVTQKHYRERIPHSRTARNNEHRRLQDAPIDLRCKPRVQFNRR